MVIFTTRLLDSFYTKDPKKILMLDAIWKTTILYKLKLKLAETESSDTTIGFNVESRIY